MGSFSSDQVLLPVDVELVRRAQRGRTAHLEDLCERFQIPLLALLFKATRDYDRAVEMTPALLETLCRLLVSGQIAPDEWASRAAREATVLGEPSDQHAAGGALEGLESIARFVRRRQVRQMLPQLPLPELTALLLRHISGWPAADMVGLVGADLEEVEQVLASVYQRLNSPVTDEKSSALEAIHQPEPLNEVDASLSGPSP